MTNKTYGPDKLTIDQMYSNRQAAKAAGHRVYFTGKACKNGHLEPKYISGSCIECIRLRDERLHKPSTRILLTPEEKIERRKAYYRANRERIFSYQQANREQIREQKKRYWQENKEALSQKRRACRQAKKGQNPQPHKSYENIREIISRRNREYYLKNCERIKQRQREYRQRMKQETEYPIG